MADRSGGNAPASARHAAIAWVIAAAFLAPIALLIVASSRPVGTEPPRSVDLVPEAAGVSNYGELAGMPSFRRQALNSLLVAAIAVPLGTLVASWAGFAAARLPRRSSRALVVLAALGASTPATALFLGRLALFRWTGVTDSPVPLIAPALLGVSPLLVLLFAWAYRSIPDEAYDLAREYGLGPFRTWRDVAFPIRLDIATVAAIVAFVLTWGNLLDPLFYVYDERWFTLPVGVAALRTLPPTDHGLMLAAAVVSLLPVVAGVAVAQRVVTSRR
jgi:multiple sugar transport system permease protein